MKRLALPLSVLLAIYGAACAAPTATPAMGFETEGAWLSAASSGPHSPPTLRPRPDRGPSTSSAARQRVAARVDEDPGLRQRTDATAALLRCVCVGPAAPRQSTNTHLKPRGL